MVEQIVELILKTSKHATKQQVNNNLYWYDSEQKKVLNFVGGALKFQYDYKSKKMLPSVTDRYVSNADNNFNKILQYVQKNNFEVKDVSSNYSITIEIDSKDFETVCFDLYRNNIVYDYDPYDLRDK